MNGSSNGGDPALSSWGSADDQCGAAETADPAHQAADEMIDDLKRRAADYAEQAKQAAAEMAAAIEQQIRKRPVEAVAVAAGIGLALGLLWNRRS
jgi:ElaB/YqjD/DUF883 family membrane-anchored ribosome-binding protein